jgi:hypothetical protein
MVGINVVKLYNDEKVIFVVIGTRDKIKN